MLPSTTVETTASSGKSPISSPDVDISTVSPERKETHTDVVQYGAIAVEKEEGPTASGVDMLTLMHEEDA